MSEEHEVYLVAKVNELMDKLAAERAKVKSLSEVIESQKQTHDALIKKCRELEAQNLELFDKAVNAAWLETQTAAKAARAAGVTTEANQ